MTGQQDKKSVRFRDELHDTREFEDDPTIPIDEIWYCGEDFLGMKTESRADAKAWRRRGFDVLLRETFEFPREDAQDYINAFCLLDEELSRRGLERFLSRQHGQERSALKDRSRYSVLDHQRKLRKSGASADDIALTLSELYQTICRAAGVFARRLAEADELFVQNGEDSTFAEKILEENDVPKNGFRSRMERRNSNASVSSVNSFDSTRLNQRNRSPIRRGAKRPQRASEQQQQEEQEQEIPQKLVTIDLSTMEA